MKASAPAVPAAPERGDRSELSLLGAFWIVAVAVIAVFAPVLSASFLMLDDPQNFVFNPSFRGFAPENLHWMFTTRRMGNWQPLSWLTHALDHALWGLDGARFHQASIAWHVLVAGVFLVVAERLYARVPGMLADEGARRRVRVAALLATLAFAIHPLRGESVAWLSGRNDIIAGLPFALALLAWLRYTRDVDVKGNIERAPASAAPNARLLAAGGLLALGAGLLTRLALVVHPTEELALVPHWAAFLVPAGAAMLAALLLVPRALGAGAGSRVAYALAWLAAALSLMGKAYAIVLPALLLALDVWPFQRLARKTAELGTAARAALVLVVEKLPFLALSLVISPITLWSKQGGDLRTLSEHSAVARVWQAFYGLAFYPRKTLVPSGLSPMYDLPAHIQLLEPRFLFSFLAVVALTALLVLFRKRAPAALAVWVAYAILIAPALGALQAGAQLVADRYSYLATMPLALGIGGLWWYAAQRGVAVRQWASAGAVAGVLALGVTTWRGSALWGDPVALFEHGIESTGSPRLMTNLAMTYNEAASNDEPHRAEYLQRALEWSERAVRTAEEMEVSVPLYRLHRGTILHNLGRENEAVADLAWFVEREPANLQGQLNLGLALERSGQPARAAEAFERCVALDPTLELAWRGLGAVLEATNERERAIASYRRALELAPGNSAVQARLRVLEGR